MNINRFNKFYVKFLVVFWMYSVAFSFLKEAHHLHELLEIEHIHLSQHSYNTNISDINSHLYQGISHNSHSHGINHCVGFYLNTSTSVQTESSHEASCQIYNDTPLYKCANMVNGTSQSSNYIWCDVENEIFVSRYFNNSLNCQHGNSYTDTGLYEMNNGYKSYKICDSSLPVCDTTILKRNWYQDNTGECDPDIYNDTLYVANECIEDGEHNSFMFTCIQGNQFTYNYYTNSNECITEEETESGIDTISEQIEFTLFFLNIEFLLALIERIRWQQRQ